MTKSIIKKATVLTFTLMLFFLLLAGTAFASVEVTDKGTQKTDTVTVEGNPDFYPYEYYDEESGTYKGLFPELLEIVSEKTGLDFEYVFAGKTDQQLYQAKTGNAELLTAFVKDDETLKAYKLTYGVTVMNGESEGEEIGIAYTRFAENGIDKKINKALSEISSDQILNILSRYMSGKPEAKTASPVIFIIIAVVVVIAVAALIILHVRKNKNKQEKSTDILATIYSREQFEVCFEELADNKNSSHYIAAYIAFDGARVHSVYGEEAVKEQMGSASEKLLNMCSSTDDLLARYNEEGFMLLHECKPDDNTEEWITAILNNVNEYVEKFDKSYKPYFKAGVYCMEPGVWNRKLIIADVLRSYQCANDKNLSYYISDPEESAANLIKNQLMEHLSQAFKDDEFKQYVQPIVNARTGKIVGAEALSRWYHPDMGILNPGRYIEMLEKEGIIFDFDLMIFEKTCMTLADWKRENCDLWLSTNFTRITISSEDFREKIQKIIDRYDFDHSKLVFEITEECLENDVDVASRNVKALSEMGFKIAIDDLGSGFTFFSDLMNYKIDMVKIDRDIVIKTDTDNGEALMKGIADLCRRLGIQILAEGVETKEQLDTVRDMDCDFIQGFYFYKPMSKADFNKIKNL